MAFADPKHCPSCGASLTDPRTCQSCGFDLTSAEARQLWQTLIHADDLLDRARAVSRTPTPVSPPATDLPKAPEPSPRPPKKRTLSTGGVILALGAACLLVAGFIFITVSWGSLGVTGRALVLLAFTIVICFLALAVSGRNLRGSAEALWTVFLGMLTLDWFAAWGQNLFGLHDANFAVVALLWMAGIFGAATLIVTKIDHGRALVMPQVVAGVSPWIGATALTVELSDHWDFFWSVLPAVAIGAALWFVAIRVRLPWTMWPTAGFTGAASVVGIGAAMSEVDEHPRVSELVGGGHALPMLVVIGLAVLAAAVLPRARIAATATAILATTYLFASPSEFWWTDRGAVIVTSAVAVGAAAIHLKSAIGRGARVASVIAALATVLLTSSWFDSAVEGIGDRWANAGHERLLAEQAVGAAQNRWWWVPLVAGVALGAVVLLTRRWPEGGRLRPWAVNGALVLVSAGVVLASSAYDGPYLAMALAAVAVGAVLTGPQLDQFVRMAGMGLIGLGATLALPTQTGTTVVWAVAGLAFIAIAVLGREKRDVATAALGATVLAGGVAGQVADLTEGSVEGVTLALVVAGSLSFVVASTLLRRWPGRMGVEVGAALVAAVGIGIATVEITLAWQSLMWTIPGAVLVVLGLTARDRSVLRWVGSGALGIAYVLRLAASDVGVVEAYTLPFGVLLLAVGAWALRRPDGPSSVVALGAGLTLALLPSLPQALDEPTSLRALLLGLGALLTLSIGVQRRWRAPFVAGASVVALLVLVNVGPYALALPRWVLIAAAGAILLGVGVTWEDRVRQGRAATRYVGDMR